MRARCVCNYQVDIRSKGLKELCEPVGAVNALAIQSPILDSDVCSIGSEVFTTKPIFTLGV